MAKSKVVKSRRKFTSEYKQAAVALVTVDGHSFREASASLGVSETLLRKWKESFEAEGSKAFPGHGRRLPDDELARLRAENERLRTERDIPEKAAAFFARELP